MSALREGVRQCMAWVHGWTGLLLGYVLFVMCLGGTLSVFKPEIGRWMRPEATAQVDQIAAIDAATRWLAANTKDSFGWYLTAPDSRMNTVEAAYSDGGAYLYRALDPVSGAPVERETLGGEFFYRLHFELQTPFPWGRLLASLAGLTMLVGLVSGVITHKKIFKDFFTFRQAKGQRSWLDGHNAVSVLALPFHFMITLTGVITLASLHMPWPTSAAYGDQAAALYADLVPGNIQRAASGEKAPLVPIAPMLREAQRRFGGAELGHIYILNPGDKAAVVTVFRSDAGQIGYNAGEVSFDGATGRVLADWTETRPGVQTYNVLYGLHLARFAPLTIRWLYFLCGAALTLAIATGLVLWIVKRRERAPLALGNRVLERVNAGVLAGVPLGAVAFLIANRLLPIDMAQRAENEVSVALYTTAFALLAGLALRPALAWPVLTTLLALACLAAPLVGSGPSWFIEAIGRGDGALLGTSLMLWVTALTLGRLGLFQWQRLRTPALRPRRRQPV